MRLKIASGETRLGAADQILHGYGVARRSGADEIGVADAEELPEIAENLLVAVYKVGGGDAEFFGGAFDIDAVLVGAGEVGDVEAAHALVARDHVADDGGVGRADVRAGVRVIDGSGEVILFLGIIHELCGFPVWGRGLGLRFDPFLKLVRRRRQYIF